MLATLGIKSLYSASPSHGLLREPLSRMYCTVFFVNIDCGISTSVMRKSRQIRYSCCSGKPNIPQRDTVRAIPLKSSYDFPSRDLNSMSPADALLSCAP